MVRIPKFLKEFLIFFLTEVYLLSVGDQIGSLLLIIRRIDIGIGDQGKKTEDKQYQVYCSGVLVINGWTSLICESVIITSE